MNRKTVRFKFIALLLTSFFLTACGGGGSSSISSSDPSNSNTTRGGFISASFLANNQAIGSPYSVDSYKIIYSTIDTENNVIKASGLLSIPRKATSAISPLLSYQHGTIFTDSDAPSNSSYQIQLIAQLAGFGYIVSSPDYLGYAESTHILHPYVHAESLASASVDMLRASKTYLASRNIGLNNQLFLAGYSEGGYATIALQKEIQENLSSEFVVSASAAGAGPYYLSETAKFLANKVTDQNPAYTNFVIKAYDSVYQLNKIDEIYKPAYRAFINSSFDGSMTASQINNALPAVGANLFETEFLAILQGSASHTLKDALALNDIYDWKPTSPTLLYHGVNDEVVPYANTSKAYEAMSVNNSAVQPIANSCQLSHVGCFLPYVQAAYTFFGNYVSNL